MKDGSEQISYTYDPTGNTTSVTDGRGNTTTYTYDKSNSMKTVSFDGGAVTYLYTIPTATGNP